MIRKSDIKKQQRNNLIIGIFLTALMVASMFGIMANNNQNSLKYNKFKFTPLQDGSFMTKVNNKEYYFSNMPQDLINLPTKEGFCKSLKDINSLNIIFNPNSKSITYIDFIRQDLSKNIDNINFFRSEESNSYTLYPITQCDNSSIFSTTIYFKDSNQTAINIDEKCYVAESNSYGFITLKDKIMYCYLGILEE